IRNLISTTVIFGCLILAQASASGAGLPDDYFSLMIAELESVQPEAEMRGACSYMFAATVLYTKQHPANPAYGEEKYLKLALGLGDVAAGQIERHGAEARQHYEWEFHVWLDTYRILETKLSGDRRGPWRGQL